MHIWTKQKSPTGNVRERVYSSKKNLKSVREKPEYSDMSHIYIDEDLTKFRANLAREARSLRNSGQINDTWTMYGKIMVKDKHNRIKIVKKIHQNSRLLCKKMINCIDTLLTFYVTWLLEIESFN